MLESIIKITVVKIHTHKIYIYTYNKENKKEKKRKKIIIIKKRQYHPPSLRKKKDSYNTPDGGSHRNSQGIGAVNCCHKDLHPRGRSCPRFSSFLCKCNLTKSWFTLVSLLKHFSISYWIFFSFLHHSHIISFRYSLCL